MSAVFVHGRHLLEQAQLVSDNVATTVELVESVDRRWASLRQSASDISAHLKQVVLVAAMAAVATMAAVAMAMAVAAA